jgi:hypothetical protein
MTLGVTGAGEHWGPARGFGLVLSEFAGGFPHLYVGTKAGIDAGFATLHARVIVGRLEQSAFSPRVAGEHSRAGSGLALTIVPAGVRGVELGFARFASSPWPAGGPGWHEIARLFSGFVSRQDQQVVNSPTENQVISAFLRWTIPGSGLEFYGEYARDDYPGNFRWLLYKPDDYGAYLFGMQRAWRPEPARMRVVRIEIVNGETTHQERGQRGGTAPYPLYVHFGETQGHTVNGRFLGSPDVYGGAGASIAVDEYTPEGRWTFGMERHLRLDWLPLTAGALPGSSPAAAGARPDVLIGARVERTWFRGGRDYTLSIFPALDLNRNTGAGSDEFNLRAAFSLTGIR